MRQKINKILFSLVEFKVISFSILSRNRVRITVNFSPEIKQIKRKWYEIFKVLKERNLPT